MGAEGPYLGGRFISMPWGYSLVLLALRLSAAFASIRFPGAQRSSFEGLPDESRMDAQSANLAFIMSWTYRSLSGEFPVIRVLSDPAYTYLQLTLG